MPSSPRTVPTCQDQRYYLASHALAVPEWSNREDFVPGQRLSDAGVPEELTHPLTRRSSSMRDAMCHSCGHMMRKVFQAFGEAGLGYHKYDAARGGAESILAPPTDGLCNGLVSNVDEAEPTGRASSRRGIVEHKNKAYCQRLVKALQQRYGFKGEQAVAVTSGPLAISPEERKGSRRVQTFNAAMRQIFLRSQRLTYSPDLTIADQAADLACQQLACC